MGQDIIGGLIDGIKSKISGLVDSVKDIAGTIASFLHFSEPDEGPLSNFHTFMPDMIDLLGKGIRGNLGKLTGPMKELAGMLIPTTGAMESISSAGNGTNGNTSLAARLDAMYEVVTKYLPRLANSQVVLDSGVLVGELSDGLNRELGKAYSWWLRLLFGEPYEAKFQSEGTGSAVHVYDRNGDEILTYTTGMGWHEKESKAETQVHGALKAAYYDAYHAARQEINAGAAGMEVQGGFDARA